MNSELAQLILQSATTLLPSINKIIELLAKSPEKDNLSDIGSTEEIKKAVELIGGTLRSGGSAANSISKTLKNLSNDHMENIKYIIENYGEKIDKEIIISAINARTRVQEKTIFSVLIGFVVATFAVIASIIAFIFRDISNRKTAAAHAEPLIVQIIKAFRK